MQRLNLKWNKCIRNYDIRRPCIPPHTHRHSPASTHPHPLTHNNTVYLEDNNNNNIKPTNCIFKWTQKNDRSSFESHRGGWAKRACSSRFQIDWVSNGGESDDILTKMAGGDCYANSFPIGMFACCAPNAPHPQPRNARIISRINVNMSNLISSASILSNNKMTWIKLTVNK